MTFFDNEKNRVGVLTSRLASDATLVQGVSSLYKTETIVKHTEKAV